MPRRSAASIAILVPTPPPPEPQPPEWLTPAQLRVWQQVLSSTPRGWIGPGQALLLAQLACHTVRREEIEQMIADADREDLSTFERLCKLSRAEDTCVLALHTSMRLTLQSQSQPAVARHRADKMEVAERQRA